jgi:hypothetical protein
MARMKEKNKKTLVNAMQEETILEYEVVEVEEGGGREEVIDQTVEEES